MSKVDISQLSVDELLELHNQLSDALGDKLYAEATVRANKTLENLLWLWKNKLLATRMIRALANTRNDDGTIRIEAVLKPKDDDEDTSKIPRSRKRAI